MISHENIHSLHATLGDLAQVTGYWDGDRPSIYNSINMHPVTDGKEQYKKKEVHSPLTCCFHISITAWPVWMTLKYEKMIQH